MLDVPHELVEYVSWLLYEHRLTCNTRWRKLGCSKQALLTLVHLRKNETFSQLGAGFGISQATAWRYVDEALDVLASWAPGLHEVLTGLGEGDHVIVDGTQNIEGVVAIVPLAVACLAKANGIPIEIESGYLPSALLLRLARRVRRIVSRGVHRGFDRSSPSPSHRTGGSRYRRPPRGGTGVDRRA